MARKCSAEIPNFEELLHLIKPMGKWQLWAYLWIAVLEFWSAMKNLAVVFFQITPEFKCSLDANLNSSWTFEQMRNIRSFR